MVPVLSDETSVANITGNLNVNEDSVSRILLFHTRESRKNVSLNRVEQPGISEFAVNKGHRYGSSIMARKTARSFTSLRERAMRTSPAT